MQILNEEETKELEENGLSVIEPEKETMELSKTKKSKTKIPLTDEEREVNRLEIEKREKEFLATIPEIINIGIATRVQYQMEGKDDFYQAVKSHIDNAIFKVMQSVRDQLNSAYKPNGKIMRGTVEKAITNYMKLSEQDKKEFYKKYKNKIIKKERINAT